MNLSKGKLASQVLGLGLGDGGLRKLGIEYEGEDGFQERIVALFNPAEINISRSVTWKTEQSIANAAGKFKSAKGGVRGVPARQAFVAVQPATLSVELFFDTYEDHDKSLSLGKVAASFALPTNPFQSTSATDVREHTKKLSALAKMQREKHVPPECTLWWGKDLFVGVLSEIKISYTMFMPDGMPVRARASCTFIESETAAELRRSELWSADVTKSRVVKRHDTLHSLAAAEYNDPALWRHIARANNIVNPRAVKPGDVLIIPPLPS